jgi:ABC-type Na+ efflux pump permease subunit
MLAGTGCYVLMVSWQDSPKDIAVGLFCTLTVGALALALLSGVGITSDCLSQEKREGTLGLLFLTDLKGYDVVLGKLVASSLNTLYSLLAILPMLAVPLLMGGITPGEFGRMAVVAVNALFLSLALGMCVSALCRSALAAAVATALLVFAITALLPLAGAEWAHLTLSQRVPLGFLLPSAGFGYFRALDANYLFYEAEFWLSFAVIHGLSWICLALASFIAPRIWQDRPAGAQALNCRERWRTWSYGDSAERAAFRYHLLDQNAFYWLAARSRLKPAAVWGCFGLAGCGWLIGWAKFGRDWFSEGVYVVVALVLTLMLKLWFALETSRQLADDRKSGTLELLLSTPLKVREILEGQFLALTRQFLGPVGAVLALDTIFLLAGQTQNMGEETRSLWVMFWLAIMVMLVADLAALYWLGMWQGLTAQNPLRASGNSLVRILLLPWAGIFIVLIMVALASMGPGPNPDLGEKFFLGLWFFLGIAADLTFGLTARRNLLTRFRRMAEQRYASRDGLWGWLRRTPHAPTAPSISLAR